MKALQVEPDPTDQVALTAPVAILNERKPGHEASVLEVAVKLGTLLPTGWRAEVEPGTIVLSWQPSEFGKATTD